MKLISCWDQLLDWLSCLRHVVKTATPDLADTGTVMGLFWTLGWEHRLRGLVAGKPLGWLENNLGKSSSNPAPGSSSRAGKTSLGQDLGSTRILPGCCALRYSSLLLTQGCRILQEPPGSSEHPHPHFHGQGLMLCHEML